nr:phage minor capsid protein [Caproiciproducens faecalis]
MDETITRDIVRRLVKTGGVSSTADWQIRRLQESGLLYEDIIRQVSQMTDASEPQVRALFQDAGIESLKYDFSIYEAAGLTPLPRLQSPAAAMVLQAGIQKTQGYLKNLSLTTATTTQQAYINAVTLAEMQVESGAFDYVTAIRNAVRVAAQSGTTVLYPTGHTDKLDVAVRRAVLTGVSQTSAQISERYADDMGCDLVETTAHAGARPSHQIWQGKVFSRSGSGKYPDFKQNTGYGTGAGLCGWNCRHSFFPFFEDLSESAYPRNKIQEYNSHTVTYNDQNVSYYDATQMQRAYERRIRATKRELAGYDEGVKSTDSDELRNVLKEKFNDSSVKLKRQESELKDFLQQTRLDRQREREQVISFGRSPAQSARHAAEQRYQQWVKNIGAKDSAPNSLAKYYKEKYNNSPAYKLLKGYSNAVDNGDISPLVGLKQYTDTAHRVESDILGLTTSTGVEIHSYATHFIDRVIGQVSTPHPGKRCGVSIEDAKDALIHPLKLGDVHNMENGDIRQTLFGKNATVTISIRDERLIQTNPR